MTGRMQGEAAPVVLQQFYRPKEACDVLRIGMATLYRRIKAGEIRVGKVGGATLISHAEIERVAAPKPC